MGVLLASYTWGEDSQRQQGQTDDNLIQECLNSLSYTHNIHIFTLRKLLIKGVVKHWGSDPYVLGGFANYRPFQVC